MISTATTFVPSINSGQALRFSKDERTIFQENHPSQGFTLSTAEGFRTSFRFSIADFRLRETNQKEKILDLVWKWKTEPSQRSQQEADQNLQGILW